MKFSMEVEADSFEEAQAAFAAVLGAEAPKPKATARPGASSRKAAEPEPEPGLDYDDDVKPLVIEVSKKLGRERALEILTQYRNPSTKKPATKGQEVDPSDWPELVADCKKALEEDVG